MKSKILKLNTLAQIVISVFCVFIVTSLSTNTAQAATNNSTLNFQARLLTSAGAVVPDGNYNVDFKIYNAATPSAGTVGTCTSPCLWEETYAYGGYAGGTATIGPQLVVKNGYITVNLGAYSTFATYALTNWSQQLYLSMNIGGTTSSGAITWDGEMGNGGPLSLGNSLLALTGVPVAFSANQLQTNNTGGLQALVFAAGTSAGTITLPDVAGFAVIAQSGTPASVTGNTAISGYSTANNFVAAAGVDALDVATGGALNIGNTTATSIVLGQSTTKVIVGNIGTATSQLYVGGNIPTSAIGSTAVTIPVSVFVQGNYAYVASQNGGSSVLKVIDISNPASPTSVGSVGTGSNPQNIYVQGRYAYVVNQTANTFQIFDISNPASPTAVNGSGLAISTTPYSVFVQGKYAYIAVAGTSLLQVYDVSNPSNPVLTASVATGSIPHYVYVLGRYAYVANYSGATLQIFDVSNPTAPVSVGSVATTYSPNYIYVQGRYAYVANQGGTGSLQIFDVSNPTAPVSVGSLPSVGGATPYSVYVQGRYAYIVNWNGTTGTLQAVDVSNPTAPVSVGSVATGNYPQSVYVQGRYAYVANYNGNTLQIFDLGGAYVQQLQAGGTETGTLSVDTNATIGGNQSITGSLGVGSTLNVAGSAGLGGLVVSGLATPSAPTVAATGTLGSTTYAYAITANNVSGSSAPSTPTSIANGAATLNTSTSYVETSWTAIAGVSSYNIYRTTGGAAQGLIGTVGNTNTLTPTSGSETGTVLTLTFANAPQWVVGQAITLSGFTMTAGAVNGTWPITGVTATTITVNITTGGATSTSSVQGTATGILGFFDTGTVATGTVPTGGTAGTISFAASNGNAVTIGTGAGTAAYSITLPTSAPSTNQCLLTGATTASLLTFGSCSGGSYINNQYASVQTNANFNIQGVSGQVTGVLEANGADILDLKNSSAVIVDSVSSAGNISIGTAGSIGTATSQLFIGGNIPTAAIGVVTTGTAPQSVYVQGSYAYIVNNTSNTLQVINISNPASPVVTGTSLTTGLSGPYSIFVQGRYAYVTNNTGATLQIFDVSNPHSPVSVGSVATGTNPYSVYVQGRYAYVVNEGSSSLQIFDVSNPHSPVSVGSVATGTNPYSVYVQGNYAYVVNDVSNTLQIFDVSNPASPILIGTSPTTGLSGPSSVYVQGRYAYVTNSTGGTLQIFDVSNPASPVSVGSVSTTGSVPWSVYVQGRYAYVVNDHLGTYLQVFDVSTPASPVSVGSVGTNLDDTSVFVQGRYAYVANENNTSLQIFDLGGAYVQQLQAGGTETGTLTVDTNAQINGSESVVGSLGVGSSINVAGSAALGGLVINGLATPTAPTVTPTGTTGSTSYTYAVVAFNSSGQTAASPTTTTSTGNATLSGSNYNAIAWTAVTGATGYNIYRTASSGLGNGATTGLVGTVYSPTLSYNDTATSTGNGATAPTIATSGTTTISTNSINAFQIENAAGTSILNVNTATGAINLDAIGTVGTSNGATTIGNSSAYAPTAALTGTTGSATYIYKEVPVAAYGATTSLISAASTSITNGNAVMSTSNYITITPTVPTYIGTAPVGYYIYRTTATGAVGTSATTGLIGYAAAGGTLVDSGQQAGAAAPTTTGTLANATYYSKFTAIDGTGGQTVPVGEPVMATGAASTSLTYSWAPVTGARGYDVYVGTASGQEVYYGTTEANYFTIGTNLTTPGTLTPSTATTGGTLPESTTYYYKIVALDASGDITALSPEASQATGATTTTNTISLSWTAVTNATSYRVYKGTTSGGENQYFTVTTNAFTDTGAAGTTAIPPTTSTAFNSTLSTTGNSQITLGNTAGSASVAQLDVAGNINPTAVGSVATGNSPNSFYLQGSYAYVANYGSGTLQVINISNPSSPVVVGSVTTGAAYSVYVQGGYAYVANYTSNSLQVINISNPSSPVVVGSVTTGTSPNSVYVQGSYAYVANFNSNTLQVINISNPSSPVVVGVVTTGNGAYSVYVQGSYAYVANYTSSTLQVINISNPSSPVVVGSVTTGPSPNSVYVQGSYAYVANFNSNTLQVINISNPSSPVVVGSVTTGPNPTSVYVQGRYGYVSGASNTLQIFDLGGAYVQQLQAGGTETGTLTVDTNSQINGSESVVGSLGVGSSLNVSGSAALGGLVINGLATPTAPTVTPTGTLGASTFTYAVVAFNPSGQSAVSTTTTVTNGNATLTSANYNAIAWTAVAGASGYNIYRTYTNATSPNTTGLIGTVYSPTLAFNDYGSAGDATTASTIATAGTTVIKTNSTQAFQIDNSAGLNVFSVDTSNAQVNIGGSTVTSSVQEWDAHATSLATLAVSPHTVGNLMILSVDTNNNTTVATVSGGGVTNWTLVHAVTDGFNAQRQELWRGSVSTTGASTITVTYTVTPGTTTELVAQEFTAGLGANTNWSVTSANHYSFTGSSTTVTFPSLTAAQSGELYWGYTGIPYTPTIGSTPGFTYKITGNGNFVTYDTNALAGITYAPTATQSSAGTSLGEALLISASLSTTLNVNSGAIVTGSNSTTSFQVQGATGTSILNTNAISASINLNGLLAPGTVTATLPPNINATTTAGTAGTTHYSYEVVAAGPNGSLTYPSLTNTLTTGNATLTATNYNIVSWVAVTGATNYYVYRTASAGTPSSTGLIAIVPSGTTTLNDTGTTTTTTTSGSETGTVLTLNYASTPFWTNQAGQQVTLAGYTMSTGSVNGTWTILTATATSMTVSIPGGVSSTISAQGTATPVDDTLNNATGTAPSQTGLLTNATTYYFKVTAIDGTGGQTIASTEASATATTATNLAIDLSWAPVTGARGYNVYYGTSAGAETNGYFTTYTNSYNFNNTIYTPTSGSETGTVLTLNMTAVPSSWTVGQPVRLSGFTMNTGSVNGTWTIASVTSTVVTLTITGGVTSTISVMGTITATSVGTIPSVSTAFDNTLSTTGNAQITLGNTTGSASTAQLDVAGNVPISALSTTVTGSNPHNVYVVGNFAYVVNGASNTLQVFDVTNPANPVVEGSVGTATDPLFVVVSGRYAYVTTYSSPGFLQVFDISNPTNPIFVNEIVVINYDTGLSVQGNYAYVLTGSDMNIINISNPTNPTYAGYINVGTVDWSIQVQGKYAYVLDDSTQRLNVIDISNAMNPILDGYLGFPNSTNNITIQGHYAYIVSNVGNMFIADISNPFNPVLVSTYNLGGAPNDVKVQGKYAYIANWGSGNGSVQIVDISNPAGPLLIGSVAADSPNYIFVQGRYAYTVDYLTPGHLQIFDLGGAYIQSLQVGGAEASTLTVDNNASVAGSISVGGSLNVGQGIQATGDSSISGSLTVSGITPNAAISSTNITGGVSATAVSGNYTYVATGSAFQIYNTFNQASPVKLSSISVADGGNLILQGHYAYTSNYAAGSFTIIDISNPSNPVVTSITTGFTYITGLAISGNYAYVVQGTSPGYLDQINISNPYSPFFNAAAGSSIDLGPGGNRAVAFSGVYVQGNYAYVSVYGNDSGLYVVNIANPNNMFQVGYSGTQNVPIGVTVQGNYAYIQQTQSIQVFDISDPSNPVNVGADYNDTPYINNMAIQGNYAYLDNGTNNTIQIEDIATPSDPFTAATIKTNANPNSISVQGNYIYVGTNNGLQIFNVGGAYVQQLQAGGTETGTLTVDNNAQIGGNESLTGSLAVSSTINVLGNSILGGLSITGLGSLSLPTITVNGTAGSTAISYAVAAFNSSGQTMAQTNSISNGNNNLGLFAAQTTVGSTTFSTPNLTYTVPSNNPIPQGISITVGSCSIGADNGTFTVTYTSNTTVTVSNASGVAGATGCVIAAQSNYNTVSWTGISGAQGYYVYRSATGGSSPSSTGLIGVVANGTDSPISGSETGTLLTLNFATSTPFIVGEGVTLSGFTSAPSLAGGTWIVESVNTTTITLYNSGGATSTISVFGTVSSSTAFYDTGIYANVDYFPLPYVANAGTISLATSSTQALQVNNTSSGNILNIDTSNAQVAIGGEASIASVQEWDAHGVGQSTLSISPHTVGNLIVLAIHNGSATPAMTTVSVSGGGVTNWTKVTGETNGTTNVGLSITPGSRVEIWKGVVTTTGAATITVVYSGSSANNSELAAQEFTAGLGSGTNWSTISSGSVSNQSATSTSVPYPTLAPNQSGELYWGYSEVSSTGLSGSSGGFTFTQTGDGDQIAYSTTLNVGYNYTPTGTSSPASTSFSSAMVIAASLNSTLNINSSAIVAGTNSATTFQVQGVAGTDIFNTNSSLASINLDALAAPIQVTPTLPSVSPTPTVFGIAGTTGYSYEVAVAGPNGSTTYPSPTGIASNGNATLAGGNNIGLSWASVTGATNYYVYRTKITSTPNSASETGTVLTLNYTATPAFWKAGQSLTLSGFTSSPFNVNNTWVIASINTTTITLTATGGSTSTVTVMGTVTGTDPSYAGLIGVTGTTSFADKGLYATGAAPTVTGSLSAIPYFFKVTAIDGTGGQTVASTEVSATASALTNSAINLSWAPVTGARGYDVYYGTSSNNETNGYFTTYTNSYNFASTSGTTAGTIPTTSTAYNNTLSTAGNSQITLGNTTGSASTAQLDVAGNIPISAVGSVATGTTAYNDIVQGNYAYVTNYNSNTLQIIDVSNPAAPVTLSTIVTGTGSGPIGQFIQGNYDYIANWNNSTFAIVNISNPSSPVLLSSATTGTTYNHIVSVQGRYAYMVSGGNLLQVIDISNPSSPVVVGSTYVASAQSMYILGHYAYIGNYYNNLEIIDISTPSSPAIVGNVSIASNANGLYVQGEYAYVSTGAPSVQIINVSNPTSPFIVSSVSLSSTANSIFLQGHYAYVTTNGGVVVLDVSTPSNPLIIGTIASGGGQQYGDYVQGRYLYTTNQSSNIFQIFDLGGAYVQQLQVGGTETGTLAVDTNATVAGSESVGGSLGIGSSLQVAGVSSLGGLVVTGLATPAAPTVAALGTLGSTTYAYAIAANNASGVSAPSTPTSVANGAATLNNSTSYVETTWSAVTGASSYSIYRTTGGSAQGLIGTIGNTNTLTPTSATETGTVATLNFSSAPQWVVGQALTLAGFTSTGTINGTWPILTVSGNSITINITGGATATISGMGTATGILGFFDTASTATGGVPSGGTAGTIGFAAANGNTITIGVAAGSAAYTLTLPSVAPTTSQCLLSGATTPGLLTFGSCGGGTHTQTITLTPEYAGATLSNNVWNGLSDIGTMTSGYDTAQLENYYQWTTTQVANQAYDVAISIPIPNDFSSWSSTTPITVDVKTSNTTTGIVNSKLYDTGKTIVTNWNTCALTPGTANTWTTVTGCNLSSGTYTAGSGNYITLIIQLQAPTNGTTEIGNINLSYNSSF